MQRLFFWGIILLLAVLLFALLGIIIYWLLRIFLAKPEARISAWVALGVMIVVIIVSCWWGHTHTRLQIQVNAVEVVSPRLPSAFDGFRVAHLSDMHIGSFDASSEQEFFQRLADSIAAQQPDIIVFTGDLVTLRSAEAIPFRKSLELLSNIPTANKKGFIPLYSILGNHDYADYVHNFDKERRKQDVDSLVQIQEEAGWKMLLNNALMLNRATSDSTSEHIVLMGVENIGEPPFSIYGDLDKAFEAVGGRDSIADNFTILLSHNPSHWKREVLPDTSIDLMLAGHTHAMQLQIGSWSPSEWKYPEWSGLYTEEKTQPQYLYVNTGIGCVGPSVRIGVKPEVTILTLSSKPQK